MQQIWYQYENENSKNYAYFYAYLELGYKRTLLGAENSVKEENSEKLAKTPSSHIKKLYKKYDWKMRVNAYDKFMNDKLCKVNDKNNIERIQDFSGKVLTFSELSLIDGLEGLRVAREALKQIDKSDLSIKEIVSLQNSSANLIEKAIRAIGTTQSKEFEIMTQIDTKTRVEKLLPSGTNFEDVTQQIAELISSNQVSIKNEKEIKVIDAKVEE